MSLTSSYSENWEAARSLFDDDREECVRLAKANLTDPELPHYWRMRNFILLGFALANWTEANSYKMLAETLYTASWLEAVSDMNEEDLAALKVLREELDHLEAWRDEQLDAMISQERKSVGAATVQEESTTQENNSVEDEFMEELMDYEDEDEAVDEEGDVADMMADLDIAEGA